MASDMFVPVFAGVRRDPPQAVFWSALIYFAYVFRWLLLLLIISVLTATVQAKTKYPPASIHLDRGGEKWAEKTLHHLSLEEKVGQVFMVWTRAEFLNVNSPEYLRLRDVINKYHVGSFVMTVPYEAPFLYKNEPYEAADLLNRLQRDSKWPLLVAADFELGLSNRLNGTTAFPNAMAIGATGRRDYAEAFGRIAGQEARAIGVEWNFFPVADVNSNPENPIINTRSFGEDPAEVADFVAAYIRGAHSSGMLATAKHFPGHGDTATDSHLGLAQVTGDRARLEAVELPPFRRAIAAGVDAIMVGHVTVPALDPTPNSVATVSPAIVTGLLRHSMQFPGIIITDALEMGALTRLYASNLGREAVDAFKAGNDILLVPPDIEAAEQALIGAVRSGEISQSRLDESVARILRLKASLGLHKTRLVDLAALDSSIGRPENIAAGELMAQDAITLVRENGTTLPLTKTAAAPQTLPFQPPIETGHRLVVVIFSDDVRLTAGRALEHQIRSRVPDVDVIYTDPSLARPMSDRVLGAVQAAEKVVVAVYASPTAGKVVRENGTAGNSISLVGASGALLGSILGAAAPKTVVIALGNPYVAKDFPDAQNYLCTFSAASVSEVAAAKALFGEIEIHGRLPVTIPGYAQRGTGIVRRAVKQ